MLFIFNTRINVSKIVLTALFAWVLSFETSTVVAQQLQIDEITGNSKTKPASIAPSDAFTYQGKLTMGTLPVSGQYDFNFLFFDAVTDGNQIAAFEALDQTVANGIFTTLITTGNLYANLDVKWVEINVRPAGSGAYTTLTPRQRLTESPLAGKARAADSATSALNAVNAVNATNAQNAGFANSANTANSATFSTSSNSSTNSANLGGIAAGNYLQKTGDGSLLTNLPGTFKWNVITSNQQAQSNFGYVADGPGEVVVTLPASPNVGDIIRVSGAGTGGWRISQNSGQIISSTESLNGTWAPRDSNRNWTAVASSANGVKLFATASIDQTYFSLDSGENWTSRQAPEDWVAIAASADGSKVVSAGGNVRITVSSNSGTSWTPVNTVSSWRSVGSSADGARLVAVDNNGNIDISTNSGTNWSRQSFTRLWRGVATSADGSTIVAVPEGNLIKVSVNSGATWTDRAANRTWISVTCSSNGTKMAAVVAGGFIYTSTDSGTTWIQRESSRQWRSITSSADGSVLAAVADNERIYISTDSGVTWLARENPRAWSSIAMLADGSKFIATTLGGQIYISSKFSSTAGLTGGVTGTFGSSIELIFLGSGRFFNLGIAGNAVLF